MLHNILKILISLAKNKIFAQLIFFYLYLVLQVITIYFHILSRICKFNDLQGNIKVKICVLFPKNINVLIIIFILYIYAIISNINY